MALSDIIKKIEDSPRSTKVAVGAVGIAVAACAVAVFTLINRPDYTPQPTPAAKVAVETRSDTRTAPAPTAPQPTFSPVPTNTPSPVPTNTPIPSPTPETSKTVAAVPTVIPTPRATATPEANDYYVVIFRGDTDDDQGGIRFFANYPFNKNAYGGVTSYFKNEGFYLGYLEREGVITPEQKNAYSNGEDLPIPLIPLSTATQNLFKTDRYNADKLNLPAPKYLTHYADESSWDSNRSVAPTPEANDYYVILHPHFPDDNEGVIKYYARYPFIGDGGVGLDHFLNEDFYLEYLRKEGVITSEQRNIYLNGEPIQVPLIPISNATYKLFETDRYNARKLGLHRPDLLFDFIGSSLDSNHIIVAPTPEDDEGYRVTIEDGRVSVSGIDAQGKTTTVSVEGESAQTLIERWLRENKITIEQSDELGQTGKLEFSLDDAVDLLNLGALP